MEWDWINGREGKPRETGLTMLIDTGMGLQSFEDLMHIAGKHIDFIKLGFGTAALTPPDVLKRKIQCANEHRVIIFPGGTFFEAAHAKGHGERYLDELTAVGFPAVEISEGTLSLPPGMRHNIIQKASRSLIVLSEVGKKVKGSHLTLEELRRAYVHDLAAGASYVIVEGRESGKDVGIYNNEGELDPHFVKKAHEATGTEIIWEAPLKSQQAALLRLLGPNTNLGNVNMKDALAVEALRRGLRSDTFELNTVAETVL